jgi:hypothetical protein
MKTIYKYTIPFGDDPTVQMPKGASILKFTIQESLENGYPNICVWAIVDTEAKLEERMEVPYFRYRTPVTKRVRKIRRYHQRRKIQLF